MSEADRSEGSEARSADGHSRLFYALDPAPATVELISRWQRSQGEREDLRPVRPESLHVTVAFLGERPDAEIPALSELVGSAGSEPIEASLRAEPVPLPRRRPQLFALELESPGAERLAADLRAGLAELGIELGERRPFWPHLTVFRVRGRRKRGRDGGRGPRRGPVQRLGRLPGGDGHAFGFRRFALYRSQLRPEGSRYSRLAATDLPQPGGPTTEEVI